MQKDLQNPTTGKVSVSKMLKKALGLYSNGLHLKMAGMFICLINIYFLSLFEMSSVKNIDPSLLGMLFGLTQVFGILFGVQILEFFSEINAIYISLVMIVLFNSIFYLTNDWISFLIQRFFVGILFNLVIYV